MSLSVGSTSVAEQVNTSYRAAQRSVERVASGDSSSSSGTAPVKVQIDIELLKKSREMNGQLATDLVEALPSSK